MDAGSPLTIQARTRRALGGERGNSVLQTVILFPVCLTLAMAAVQIGILFQARAVARGAAQEGARVAAAETALVGDGIAAATAFTAHSGDALRNTQITGTRTATAATITVSGAVLSILPGYTLTVSQTGAMPVEKVTG